MADKNQILTYQMLNNSQTFQEDKAPSYHPV